MGTPRSALENATAKSHMPGIATTLKTIMNRASEVKGMTEDKTRVQKMNEQAQLQNCTVDQLLDHVVQGDKSRLHDVHSNNAAFSTTGSHEATPKHQFTQKELDQTWLNRHKFVDTKVLAHFPNKAALHADKCNNCRLAGHRKCMDVNGAKTLACLATGNDEATLRMMAPIKQPIKRNKLKPCDGRGGGGFSQGRRGGRGRGRGGRGRQSRHSGPDKPCWHFQKGECRRGEQCHFAHAQARVQTVQKQGQQPPNLPPAQELADLQAELRATITSDLKAAMKATMATGMHKAFTTWNPADLGTKALCASQFMTHVKAWMETHVPPHQMMPSAKACMPKHKFDALMGNPWQNMNIKRNPFRETVPKRGTRNPFRTQAIGNPFREVHSRIQGEKNQGGSTSEPPTDQRKRGKQAATTECATCKRHTTSHDRTRDSCNAPAHTSKTKKGNPFKDNASASRKVRQKGNATATSAKSQKGSAATPRGGHTATAQTAKCVLKL